MEIVVTARHTEVPGRFRRHLEDKLSKVAQFAPRAQRLEVAVSHEVNKRQSHNCERIELTLIGKGPVVRAEACSNDTYVALDLASAKLVERLRRASDRRKVHHGRHPHGAGHAPSAEPAAGAPAGEAEEPVLLPEEAPVAAAAPAAAAPEPVAADGEGALYALGESPVVIRDKVHVASPMGLEQALWQMELVGHDFYLFIDEASGCPSVVYRRKGWSYGVLRLAGSPEEAARAQEVGLAGARPAPAGAAGVADDAGAGASATSTEDGAAARQPVAAGRAQ